ncbi:MAG: hypothetical protein APR54_08245 [Candidatus Cloacimonas sp. SDB]|nr:MAG: hypothetical protein APR54_08245 [Candidatus Cloacimonas sp. SDB]
MTVNNVDLKADLSHWLKCGNQSLIDHQVKTITNDFAGNDFEKVIKILNWKNDNLSFCKNQEEVLKVFATRNVTEILQEMTSTGCHDDALIVATFCRSVGIPSKYVAGINKLDPRNRGHCVVEIFINNKWMLLDQSRFNISIFPERSEFYRNNYIVGKGLDSWEIGISTFQTWVDKSNQIISHTSSMFNDSQND